MSVRKSPALSDILARFQEYNKTAEEVISAAPEETIPPVAVDPYAAVPTVAVPAPQAEADTETITEKAEDVVEASHKLEHAKQDVDQAETEYVEAADALKAIASESFNEHTAALAKEAQLFGHLFAASAMDSMQKTATVQQIETEAYQAAQDAIGSYALQEKLASIYENAYNAALYKIAEGEAYQVAAQQAGMPIASVPAEEANAYPTPMYPQALMAEPEAEPEVEPEAEADAGCQAPECGSDYRESVADAVTEAASAAQSAADAAKMLASHLDDDEPAEEPGLSPEEQQALVASAYQAAQQQAAQQQAAPVDLQGITDNAYQAAQQQMAPVDQQAIMNNAYQAAQQQMAPQA